MSGFYRHAYENPESLEQERQRVVQETLQTGNKPPSESFLNVDDHLESKPPDEKSEYLKMQLDYMKTKGFEWFRNAVRGWYFPTLNAVGVTTMVGEKEDPSIAQDVSLELLHKIQREYPNTDVFSFIGGPHLLVGKPSQALNVFMNYLFRNANKWHTNLVKEAAYQRWWLIPGAGMAGAALAALINMGIPNNVIEEKSRQNYTPQQIVQEYIVEEPALEEPVVEESEDTELENLENMPRGIRNNNPGNIESRERWQGMAENQGNDRFITFESPEYGIRAMARILRNYQRKHNLMTVQEIISRWAPPTENNTRSYVDHVAGVLNISPNEPVDLSDDDTLGRLIEVIIRHENGNNDWYDAQIIQKGIQMEKSSSAKRQYHYAYKQMDKLKAKEILLRLLREYGQNWDVIVRELINYGVDKSLLGWLNREFISRIATDRSVWHHKYT